jgi:hypothetical protein
MSIFHFLPLQDLIPLPTGGKLLDPMVVNKNNQINQII